MNDLFLGHLLLLIFQFFGYKQLKLMPSNNYFFSNSRPSNLIQLSTKNCSIIQTVFILALLGLISCCGQLCQNCITQTNSCTQCISGYYLKAGECLQCHPTCKTCSVDNSNCTSCFNITLGQGQTKQWCYSPSLIESPSHGNYFLILGIVMSVIICILLIVVGLMCKFCKYHPQANIRNISSTKASTKIESFPSILLEMQWEQIKDKKIGDDCSICLEQGSCYLQCGHVFHPHCIQQWAKNSNVCPVCKIKLQKITVFCKNCQKYGFKVSFNEVITPEQAYLCINCQ